MNNTAVDRHPTSGSEPAARGFYFSKQFAPADVEQSIPARFESIVARNPTQIAVQTANQSLSYADLNAQANRLAHRIIAERGLRAEPVALWFERSDALAASVLGVLKAGRFVVLLDPLFPLSRIETTLEDSQAELMITDRQDPATLAGFRAAGRQILEFDGIDPESPPADPRLPISPADIAFIFYTSGSTGAPKGVVHSHRNVLHNVMLRTTAYEVFTHDRVSLLSSSTSNSIIITFLALLDGATLLPFDVRKQGVVRLGPWLRREKISVCRISGPLFRSLCETLRPEEKFPDLRVLRLTSETVYKTDVDLYKRHCAPHCVFVNGLSSSEAGLQRKYVVHFDGEIAGNEVPVGYPVIDKEIVLLDDDGNQAGVGEIGEIVVRSRYLSLGYWRKPELTAAKFKSDPNGGDARMYFSGDLAVMRADGCLIHKGRKDFKVKIRGYSVEPAEIEKALRAHDSIKDAVVLARRHKSGEDRLTAYYTSSGSPAPKLSNLREFLSRKLPDYMVPSGFVSLQAMPLTSNGKIDRRALPDPASSRPDIATAYVAPRTGLEAKLAAIWVEVFGVDRVGVDDDFFALGGHSLLAARIIARTSDACRTELPLRTLFELGNIAKLAAWIEQATGPAQAASVAPIIPIARDRELPLSFAQQRLWFLDRLDPGSFAHNLQRVFRLKGRLNVDALEQSFNQIVDRHEVLRTIIETVDGRPRQIIVPSATIKVSRVDLQGIAPERNRQAEANRLCLEQARRPFDLAKGPLLRVMLLKLGADEHLLVRTLHHIVFDVWSMGILARDLSTYYRCLTTGATASLPPLEIQYADYASWQRQRWNDDALASQRRYWKNLLDTLPPELELPADRPPPALPAARGRRCFFSLSADVLERLKAVCEQKRATLFMVLAAAFQTLLQRYTGQEDILIGSPVAGRDRGEVENLIGFFLNLLPLRSDFSGNPTFLELVDRVREVCLSAFANQELPFEKIVEEVQPERTPSYSPLFRTTFTLENTPGALLGLDGLTVEEVDGAEGVVRFDLECVMMEQGSGLRGFVSYDISRFEAPTIERMVGHFQNLLESIAADPSRRLSELALLSDAERQQLLAQWNDTQRDYPRDASIGELFEAQAERRGNAAAVVVGDQRLSYRELNRRANQCARYLLKIGVGRDVPVSFCADASLHRIVGLLAILKAGGAYVPLDPEYPKARLAFMIEDCQAPVLLTQETLLSRLPAHGGQTVCLDRDWPEIAKERAENPDWKTPAESLAYVIYTSGSSGEPKGIAVPHRAVNHLVINTDYVELSRDDVIAQASNISFDAATFEIWGALLNGARLVVLSRDTMLSPAALAAAIERHGITTLFLTTALFNQMAERIPGALAKLNCLLFGGESADPQPVRALLEKAPPKRLLHVYGPSESTTFASWYRVKTLAADAPAVPIGKPIANTQIYILDPALNPVPIGVTGEIHIGGGGLARNYFNRPELSAERFIANPFDQEQGSRLYKTGDQARYLPDGNIEFIGRLDGQVKIRGYRIEPGEIEATLIQHPAVKECAVVAEQESGSDSEDNRRLAAYVAAGEPPAPAAQELRRFLKQKLPDYMIPSAFLFVETMPLTPNGKIDRKALAAVANKRPAALDTAQAAPKTITEETVARIWLELLKLDRVGMHDNFFDLGGHSLLAVELLERIRRQFGIELPVRAIFDTPTVAGLAARLDAHENGALSDSIQIKDSYSFLVELHRGNGKAPLFMIPGGFGREDELLALGRLARAMGAARRCYGLRARSAGRTEHAHWDVRDMAAEYLKEVRATQPEGPYYLVGECVAGAVAYEMARQLRAGGQAVGLLALLDATCPNRARYLKYRANLVLKKYIRRAARLLHGRNGSSRKREKPRDRAHYKRISSPVVIGNQRRRETFNVLGWFQPSVKRSYLDVLQRCRLESYEGPLTLFYAKETNRQATIKKWKKLVSGAVEICYVPGDHETYIREHVDVLAKQLRLCLDKAVATSLDDGLRKRNIQTSASTHDAG